MTGVDVPISDLIAQFIDELWLTNTNEFNGRCSRNRRDEDNSIIPEVLHPGEEEYKEVLLDDRFDAVCFFDVLNTRELVEGSAKTSVNIHFAVNLAKLYDTIPERATEYAYQDVLDIINTSQFNAEGLVSGVESYSPFKFNVNDDMQPYHLFRIETKLDFDINGC